MAEAISAIIITKNEARNLPDCLQSLSFCDEILVVDSGSTDGSQDMVRAAGARLIERAWPGYGPQKEFARTEATGPWVLSLDADERITPALRKSILAAVAAPAYDAYEMSRLSTFLGREMRHGGWLPDYCLRLFRKDAARFSLDPVHESVRTDRPVGRLSGQIEHHTTRTMAEVEAKIESYSTLGAKSLAERGKHVGTLSPFSHGAAAFVRSYLLKRGFLDGYEGFVAASTHMKTVYWKYKKALQAQRTR